MAVNIKKYKKKIDELDKTVDRKIEELKDVTKNTKKITQAIEEELNESLYEDDEDSAKTSMQSFIKWIKKEYDSNKISENSLSIKAFELLSEEKSQLVEFFKMGFQYGLLQTDENIEDYDLKEVQKIAEEYYDNMYSDL